MKERETLDGLTRSKNCEGGCYIEFFFNERRPLVCFLQFKIIRTCKTDNIYGYVMSLVSVNSYRNV